MDTPVRLRPWHVADLGAVAPRDRDELIEKMGRADQMCVVYQGRTVGSVDLSGGAPVIEISGHGEADELRAQVVEMLRRTT